MIWNIILPPVVGAGIGYVTNDIAIKMLFHPKKPVFIGKWQLPFTPGLIPKERARIAKSIGGVISRQLLNKEVITAKLTSETVVNSVQKGVYGFIEKQSHNESTVNDILSQYVSDETKDKLISGLKSDIIKYINKKIESMSLQDKISEMAFDKIKEFISHKLSFFAAMISDDMISSIADTVGETVCKLINENAEPMLNEFLDEELSKLTEMKISDIISDESEKKEKLSNVIMSLYEKLVTDKLPLLIEKLDIAGTVEEQVANFDADQLEQMIFGIMKKELRAIVYLGALLGFILGCINIFI